MLGGACWCAALGLLRPWCTPHAPLLVACPVRSRRPGATSSARGCCSRLASLHSAAPRTPRCPRCAGAPSCCGAVDGRAGKQGSRCRAQACRICAVLTGKLAVLFPCAMPMSPPACSAMRKPSQFPAALSISFSVMLACYSSLAAAGYWCGGQGDGRGGPPCDCSCAPNSLVVRFSSTPVAAVTSTPSLVAAVGTGATPPRRW